MKWCHDWAKASLKLYLTGNIFKMHLNFDID